MLSGFLQYRARGELQLAIGYTYWVELSKQQVESFRERLWDYYARHGRFDLLWRQPDKDGTFDPYRIMVSEVMLQQTQVARVTPKYETFLRLFPSAAVLAAAELGDVLRAWQGLGYNRRAKFLWQAARVVVERTAFPDTLEGLVKLPGIGINTAGAILAYAYNHPAIFIETNIRTVYIHRFYNDQTGIDDKNIYHLIEQTIDREQAREFYWALMDYGSHLKASVGNASKASKHYTKQSKFDGSRRQVRGRIIRTLGGEAHSLSELNRQLADDRLEVVLAELVAEGLIRQNGSMYSL